jgi:hypothetical protein
MGSSFTHLRDFLQKYMRMSHIYQPVTIKELLQRGGPGRPPRHSWSGAIG